MCKNIAKSPPLSKQSKFRNLDLSSLKFTPVTSSQEARLFQSDPNYIYPKKLSIDVQIIHSKMFLLVIQLNFDFTLCCPPICDYFIQLDSGTFAILLI